MKSAKFLFISVISIFFLCLLISCNRGTGCPAEDAKVKVDKNGNPKKRATSGIYDSKGRMNSKGYKSDRRKPKKHKNYKN
ncbi:MAG: hypothetical protein HOP11_06275 [Saprospiraceae bacterium]|nr:hypothetical protein [Saprospiraceae bacterium]